MRLSGILLVDGPADLPLDGHLEQLCLAAGAEVAVEVIDPRRLPSRVSGTVAARLRFLREQNIGFDVAFVHRDAEAQDPELRRQEIAEAAKAAGITCPMVPVVPVRMTEAWLLLDEKAIRRVSGKPSGRVPLDLPTGSEAERLSDPKQRLSDLLLQASETTGRRRDQFKRDISRYRRLLLEQLDPERTRVGIVSVAAASRRYRDGTHTGRASVIEFVTRARGAGAPPPVTSREAVWAIDR